RPAGRGATEMNESVLTDAYHCTWKDIDLSGALLSWNDKIAIRIAMHRYLKRDGGEAEPMGAEPGAFTMRFVFMGRDWAKRYGAPAAQAFSSTLPDASLPIQLAAASAQAAQALLAVRAAAILDAEAYDVLALVELTHAACLDLDQALAAELPVIITYVVPG